MNFLKKLFFGSGSVEDAATTDGEAELSGARKVVVRVPRQPVISDALDPPLGGIQGLRWFFETFKQDEWGNLGHDVLEAVQGQLRRARRRRVKASDLGWDATLSDGSLHVCLR